MKFHIITFGCQMNVCDSDWLSYALQSLGWEPDTEDQAQCFIVNTCSVRDKPEQKVYSLLGRLKAYWEANPHCFAAVGGCVAQQVGTAFWKRFPFVRLVFGTDGVPYVPAALQQIARHPKQRIRLLDFLDHYPERERHFPATLPAQGFVNIMQGCDNFCAYCIVPYTRGRQKSRKAHHIMDECRALVQRGVREITLLGQNVNSYGLDGHGDGVGFAELLHRVAALPGLDRLRFTTSHPKDIAPEVIEAFGSLPNLCPQLHLPVQSGSDRLLQSMGRMYTRKQYERIVQELRLACPEIVLTTDLIVGFPGETDQDFEDTLELMRLVRYASSFSFKYSDRPGVRAQTMQGKVSESVKQERLQRLQDLQAEHTVQTLEAQVGQTGQVLVEGLSRKSGRAIPCWRGRDGGGRIVHFDLDTTGLVGKIIPVTITQAKKHSLRGEVSGSPW